MIVALVSPKTIEEKVSYACISLVNREDKLELEIHTKFVLST